MCWSRGFSNRRGRWLTALLSSALAVLLAGCAAPSLPLLPWQQTHGPTSLPDAQQVLHISAPGLNTVSVNLDPIQYVGTGFTLQSLLPLIYSGLLTFDSALRPIPALAAEYSVSADGLRYTFHLRPGARFSDNAPITSTDVAYSLDRAAGPCESFAAFAFAALQDQPLYANQQCQFNQHAPPTITSGPPSHPIIPTLIGDALLAPDPRTLVVVLSRPDGALLAKLAEPYSSIVERAVALHYGGAWPQHLGDNGGQGTSGMYFPSASGPYDNGLRITLERSKDFWGARPLLREVVIDLRPVDQIAPGDDVIFNGPDGFSQQHVTGDTTWHKAPTRSEELLALDPNGPDLRDIRVRRALALALDKTALATSLSGQATNHLTPPGSGAYSPVMSGPIASAPLQGDVAQAKALWQSYVRDRCGGVASHCPVIHVYITDWLLHRNVGILALSARWMSVLPGLRISMDDVPDTLLLFPTIPRNIIVPFTWHEDYPDPQDWLSFFTPIPDIAIQPMYHESQADALVAQAEATRDPAARLALYRQAEDTLLNDAVVIPIAQNVVVFQVKPTVVNFPAHPSPWIAPLAWARIYLTAPAGK